MKDRKRERERERERGRGREREGGKERERERERVKGLVQESDYHNVLPSVGFVVFVHFLFCFAPSLCTHSCEVHGGFFFFFFFFFFF